MSIIFFGQEINAELFYKMDCICYLNELVSDIKKGINDDIHFQQNIQLNENNEFLIEEKNRRENVYVMVVSKNIKTNELASFIILLYLYIRRLSKKNRFDLSKKDDGENFGREMGSHRSYNNGYSTLRRNDF